MPPRPASEKEWAACAESLFWLGHFDIPYELPPWLTAPLFAEVIAALPLETLADVVLGVSGLDGERSAAVLAEHRPRTLARFKRETQTVMIEDTGGTVRAHFWMPPALVLDTEGDASPDGLPAPGSAGEDPFHHEGMRRVSLLRRLLPDRGAHGCQGYGHRVGGGLFDSTTKTAIPKHSLPPRWLARINAAFRGYATYPFRPDDWSEYARAVIALRRTVIEQMAGIERALSTYFATRNVTELVGKHIDADKWERRRQGMRDAPLLPKCVADAWGFSDEGTDATAATRNGAAENNAASLTGRRSLALQRYMPLHKSLSEYTHNLGVFVYQALHVLLLNPILGRSVSDNEHRMRVINAAAAQGIRVDFQHLSTVNFSTALRALPEMQRRFRDHLGRLVPHDTLT